MPIFRTLGATVAITLAAAWLAGHAQQTLRLGPEGDMVSPARTRYVLTDREAFLPFTPELVAAPTVLRAHWSPDGRHVLAVREEVRLTALDGRPPEGETSLLLWNRRDRRSTVLWKQPVEAGTVEEEKWLPGSGVALAVVHSRPSKAGDAAEPRIRRELLRIDAARGVARAIALMSGDERLFVSPTQPVAVLLRRETHGEPEVGADGQEAIHFRHEVFLRVARAGGTVGPPIRVPSDIHDVSWTSDGRCVIILPNQAPPGQPRPVRLGTIDLTSGAIHPLPARPQFHEPRAPDLPVRVTRSSVPLGKGTPPESVRPLWLESAVAGTTSRALLCGDSPGGILAPDGSGVLYFSQGAAWVTPLLRMPKQAFLEARRAAFKTVAMSNAKQVGLALMMYIQDYDEVYPPADETIVDRLMPYVKQEAVFQDPTTGARGFVYLHRVAPASAIKEPAKTPIGHLTGPGGRAVIFADGHVVWEDQQPAGNR